MLSQARLHLLLLAAGSGRRFAAGAIQGPKPKQYVEVAGQSVISHSLNAFKNTPLQSAVVTLSPGDAYWSQIQTSFPVKLNTTEGGRTRAESVKLGLRALQKAGAENTDWVLVHDAARCCVTKQEIDDLVTACQAANQGGLLVSAMNDTLKLSGNGRQVDKTIDRNHVYAALTPQMFPLGELLDALVQAEQNNRCITDESSAMEACGYYPLMVPGKASNIKLTRVEQLPQIEVFLTRQESIT